MSVPPFLKRTARSPGIVVEAVEGDRMFSWYDFKNYPDKEITDAIGDEPDTAYLHGKWTATEMREIADMMEASTI
jgi:hypothetical protein